MVTYEVVENNIAKIYKDDVLVFIQYFYPDGTEWTYEQAQEWARLQSEWLEDPINNPTAPIAPLT